ncbi:MAG: hypothetical protein QOF60_2386 [Actinomycetota bacterium]|jgi:glycosyltransferase involved in cell wall biosynthesis|nr:hypothetical protein [Actinomycetota bacterium]
MPAVLLHTLAVRVALFITEDWYACSHRLPLIEGAVAAGHQVLLLTHVADHRHQLEQAGAIVEPIPLERSGTRPAKEAKAMVAVIAALRRFRPHVLHNVALKPVVYGTSAAHIARVPAVVNAMAGLGALFIEGDRQTHGNLRRALGWALRTRRSWVLVQNKDDALALGSLGVRPDRITVIRGSGVDLTRFAPVPEPVGPEAVVRFFGRLLWDKGVGELHEAARLLRRDGSPVRVELVGGRDPHNPACVDEATVERWRDEGILGLHGLVADVRPLVEGANVVVLPSYREGLPKALLEGAAAGRALVATDVPGCREVVRHEDNGLLVPARDASALAFAIDRLARDPVRRSAMGQRSRELAEAHFGVDGVVSRTLELYERAAAR